MPDTGLGLADTGLGLADTGLGLPDPRFLIAGLGLLEERPHNDRTWMGCPEKDPVPVDLVNTGAKKCAIV